LLNHPPCWYKMDSIKHSKRLICYYILLLGNNYFFESESSSLDGRHILQHMIQVCPASSVSPQTALNISSSFVYEQLEHFHSKPVIGFKSCAVFFLSRLGGLQFGVCCDGGGDGGGKVCSEKEFTAERRKSTETITSI
jgi:hypothetical protein